MYDLVHKLGTLKKHLKTLNCLKEMILQGQEWDEKIKEEEYREEYLRNIFSWNYNRSLEIMRPTSKTFLIWNSSRSTLKRELMSCMHMVGIQFDLAYIIRFFFFFFVFLMRVITFCDLLLMPIIIWYFKSAAHAFCPIF